MKIVIDHNNLIYGELCDGRGGHCAIGLILKELGVTDEQMVGKDFPADVAYDFPETAERIFAAGLASRIDPEDHILALTPPGVKLAAEKSDELSGHAWKTSHGPRTAEFDLLTALKAIGVDAEVLA